MAYTVDEKRDGEREGEEDRGRELVVYTVDKKKSCAEYHYVNTISRTYFLIIHT